MPGFAALADRLAAACFDTLGETATLTPPGGAPIQTLAILDRSTHLLGQLGDVVDPRPSVELPVADVGNHPRGTLVIGTESFELDRPVEGENDGLGVKMWVTAA